MIKIEEMRQDEKKEAYRVAKKAFQPLLGLLFSTKGRSYVAKEGDKIVGGVVVKTFETKGDLNGFVAYLYVDPDYGKKGIGRALVKHGVDVLNKLGCIRIFTTIEGNNTSSQKTFYNNGLRPISFTEQIKLYGLDLFKIILNTGHSFDIGYYLWSTDIKKERKTSQTTNLISNIILNTLIIVLLTFRRGHLMELSSILRYLSAFAIIFLFKFTTDHIAASINKLKVRYKMWDSGITFNLLLASTLGGFCPSLGSVYPDQEDWNYYEKKDKLGRIAAISVSAYMLFIAAYYYLNLPFNREVLQFATTFLIFDLMLPFAPFNIYNSKKIWNYNRGLWLGLASIGGFIIYFI